MDSFIEILKCNTKQKLAKACKNTEVLSSDFAAFILMCNSGDYHLEHTIRYHDFVPEHLETTDEDFNITLQSKEIISSPKGQKSLNRLFKSHGERKIRIGHLFYERPSNKRAVEWHFIFFDMDELKENDNHWVGGSHIHISNYLWPELNIEKTWREFTKDRKFPNAKMHIKYNRNA